MLRLILTPSGVGYTDDQAHGAIPNGTRVRKMAGDAGDRHAIGDHATIIGSIAIPPEARTRTDDAYFYFVTWDDMPNTPVGVVGWKLEADTTP